jgi:hypothetical protein
VRCHHCGDVCGSQELDLCLYFRNVLVYCDILDTRRVMLGTDGYENPSDAFVCGEQTPSQLDDRRVHPTENSENYLFASRCLHSRISSTGRWLLG